MPLPVGDTSSARASRVGPMIATPAAIAAVASTAAWWVLRGLVALLGMVDPLPRRDWVAGRYHGVHAVGCRLTKKAVGRPLPPSLGRRRDGRAPDRDETRREVEEHELERLLLRR